MSAPKNPVSGYVKGGPICPQGHPFTEENTYFNERGSRRCKECDRSKYRRYVSADPHYTRRAQLKNKYALSLEEYDRLYEEQEGLCAICGLPEEKTRRGKVLPLHIDHNHETGEVRALLCHRCNAGIGYLRENPDILRSAIDYLEQHVV